MLWSNVFVLYGRGFSLVSVNGCVYMWSFDGAVNVFGWNSQVLTVTLLIRINYFIAFVKIDFFFLIFPLHVEVKDREKDEPLPS